MQRKPRPRALWIGSTTLGLLAVGALAWGGWSSWETLSRMGCTVSPADVTTIRLPQAPGGVTRFIALGDTGTGLAAQMDVARAARRVCRLQGCDFLVLLGDNFYRGGLDGGDEAKFQKLVERPYGRFHIPIIAALGNHDLESDPKYQVAASRSHADWKMPSYRYAFQSGAARFFVANTNCGALEWLRLAGPIGTPSPDWTFVMGHHSVFSTGPHGDSDWLTEHVWDWFVEPKVDFMLGGHNHVLEHLVEPGEPTDYLVVGSSGRADDDDDPAEATETGEDDEGPRHATQAKSLFFSDDPGFAWLEVTPEAVHTVFYDERGRPLNAFTRTREIRSGMLARADGWFPAPLISHPFPGSRAPRGS